MRGFLTRNAPILLGAAMSALLMWLALRHVSLAEVVRAAAGAKPGWLIPMIGVILVDLTVRALRWRLLLKESAPHAPLGRFFRLEAIGLAVNNVVFLRIGELVRAYLAARELGVPVLTAFASIVVERTMDMAALLAVFGWAAMREGSGVPEPYGLLALMASAGLAVFLAALPACERFLPDAAHPSETLTRRLAELLRQAARGTRGLRSFWRASAAASLSLALWLTDSWLYWTGARAMGLGDLLGYNESVLVLASAAAASFLPAVPGSFGSFELAVKKLMEHFGASPEAALGYAGFVHAVNYLLVTAIGVLFLYQAGYSLAKLKALSEPTR